MRGMLPEAMNSTMKMRNTPTRQIAIAQGYEHSGVSDQTKVWVLNLRI